MHDLKEKTVPGNHGSLYRDRKKKWSKGIRSEYFSAPLTSKTVQWLSGESGVENGPAALGS